MTYRIRAAGRRDVPALRRLAEAQALAYRALDPRLPAAPQTLPFMSRAGSLSEALSAQGHAAFLAERGGEPVGAVNLHRIEQEDEDEFASYYPRRFAALGLLATAPGAADALGPLIARAAQQAERWHAPSLLLHHPSAAAGASGDAAPPEGSPYVSGAALRVLGFRTYYHYAVRPFAMPFSAPPVEGVGVRRATSADLDAAVRIGIESVHFHAACEPTMQPAHSEPRKMRARFEALLGDFSSGTLLVAARGDRVVGFYSVYSQQIDDTWSPPLFAPGRYGLIAEVAVDARERGRGVGRQLFEAVDAWFRARAVQAYWLIYLPHNPLSSRFWSALGFTPVWDVLLLERA